MSLQPYEFISPDNNKLNDRWSIRNGSDFPDLMIHVYNRWEVGVCHLGPYMNTWMAPTCAANRSRQRLFLGA